MKALRFPTAVIALGMITSCSEERGTAEDVYTNVYRLQPSVVSALIEDEGDKIPKTSSGKETLLKKRPSIQELLEAAGVDFPEGTEAYNYGSGFVIRNTEANIKKMEEYFDKKHGTGGWSAPDQSDAGPGPFIP